MIVQRVYKMEEGLTDGFKISVRQLCLVLGLSLASLSSFSQEKYASHQPYASYWFIEQLLEWNMEADPSAKFNVSHVALRERFIDTGTQLNAQSRKEPSIVSLVASHPTSNHPSQGFQTVEQYAFPYWQYIDYFVQWGGSSGEGIVVSPTVPWIDAAHRNGVRVLGTVFFPPNVYGGKEEWVREFLQKDEKGGFLVADKLIAVAQYYGFEGWFINQETNGMNPEDAKNMQDFMVYYQAKAKGQYMTMWYDAMIEDGRVVWQDEFNHHNAMYFQQEEQKLSDIMFIDFGWSATQLEDSHQRAKDLGRSPWELYAGIDVQSKSYKTHVDWESLYKNDRPYTTSIGLYWPNSTFDIAKDKQPESVYKEEQKFWNGTVLEEEVPAWRSKEWKGFANYFPERSTINKLPFVTHFNYGLGRFYNEAGRRLSDQAWHNLSSQDVLPSWQWDVDTSRVSPSIDFNESFTGGSCLRVEIKQSVNETFIPLYKTDLMLVGDEKMMLTAKGAGELALMIQYDDMSTERFPVVCAKEWKSSSFARGDVNTSRKIVKIGLGVKGNVGQIVYIGQLCVVNRTHSKIKKPEVSIKSFMEGDSAEMYLHIDGDDNSWYHSVYRLKPNGNKVWLGQTSSSDYYVPFSIADDASKKVTIQVMSMAQDGTKSKPVNAKLTW